MSLRALIVDDNAIFLEAARQLLEREGIAVVGVATGGDEALRVAMAYDLDVVLIDVDLGQESGFDLADRLDSSMGWRTPIVLISNHCEEDLRDLVEMSPAIGFVPKAMISGEAIVEALGNGDAVDRAPLR